MSTCLMTSFSFTSLKPSMLGSGQRYDTNEISTTVSHQKLISGGDLPRLQGTDRVDLCDIDDGAHCFEGSTAAFSHLSVTDTKTVPVLFHSTFRTELRSRKKNPPYLSISADNHLLASEHDVSGPLETTARNTIICFNSSQ